MQEPVFGGMGNWLGAKRLLRLGFFNYQYKKVRRKNCCTEDESFKRAKSLLLLLNKQKIISLNAADIEVRQAVIVEVGSQQIPNAGLHLGGNPGISF